MTSGTNSMPTVLQLIQDKTRRFISRGAHYLEWSVFENGEIYNARIDMNNKRIQNVGTPVANGDAVPYGLFQDVTYEYEAIELSGVAITSYANSPLSGTYFVNVRCQTDGGPTACWNVSRNSPSGDRYSKVLINSVNGNDDVNTMLDLSWPSNSPIMIWKNSDHYNGIYEIKMNR